MSDSANSNEVPAIDILREAVDVYVREMSDEGEVLTSAVIVWESSTLDKEQSGVVYESNYAVITDSSLSSAVGLMTVGRRMILDDALDGSLEDED